MPHLQEYAFEERVRRLIVGVYHELIENYGTEKRSILTDGLEEMDALQEVMEAERLQGPDEYWEWHIDEKGAIDWWDDCRPPEFYDEIDAEFGEDFEPDLDEDKEKVARYEERCAQYDREHPEMGVEERRLRLLRNKYVHLFLRRTKTQDAANLLQAMKECAFAKKGTKKFNWEVTASGHVVLPDPVIDETQAASVYGSWGGRAKVAKGFAKKTPAQRAAAGHRGMIKRWGRQINVQLEILYLPKHEEAIIEAARRIDPEVDSIDGAVVRIISSKLSRSELELLGLMHHVTRVLKNDAVPVGETAAPILDAITNEGTSDRVMADQAMEDVVAELERKHGTTEDKAGGRKDWRQ